MHYSMRTIISIRGVLLITVMPFFIAAKCNKDQTRPCFGGTVYSFAVTAEFTLQREVYNLGDTVFLASSFPKTLIDDISNQSINYSNSLAIAGNIRGIYMDTITRSISYNLSAFELVNFIGTYTFISNSQNEGLNMFYKENNNNYEIKIGFKCLKKGLYYLGITDLASKGIIGKDCTNAGFNMTVSNSNKNINLFQYALGYTPDALLQKSIYCFRVQ